MTVLVHVFENGNDWDIDSWYQRTSMLNVSEMVPFNEQGTPFLGWFGAGSIFSHILPLQVQDAFLDVACAGSDLDSLRRVHGMLLSDQSTGNVKVGDIHIDSLGLWIELAIQVLSQSKCDIGMNRLITC